MVAVVTVADVKDDAAEILFSIFGGFGAVEYARGWLSTYPGIERVLRRRDEQWRALLGGEHAATGRDRQRAAIAARQLLRSWDLLTDEEDAAVRKRIRELSSRGFERREGQRRGKG